ncbi:MAG TPA: LysR substrate-binding domain-containing protein [Rhizomicrobium sp.]
MAVNLKHLDLNLLVVFDVVYTTRNISRAANQLAMSQPAVSNALARLRELLGDPLFIRGRRGVEPTVKAHQMARTVRDALAMIGHELAPETLDLATYRRHFRIILPDVFEPILMPPLLREICARAPGVTVEALSVFRTDFQKEIREGKIDLACHVYPMAPAPDLVSEMLCDTDLVLLARRGHPRLGKGLDVAIFMALDFVVLVPELREVISASSDLTAQGVKRREVYTVNKLWAMPPIIERTDLVGIMPRWFHREMKKNFDLEAFDLPVKLANQHCSLTWLARNKTDPGHTWLREALSQAFRAHVNRTQAPLRKPGPRGRERRKHSALS